MWEVAVACVESGILGDDKGLGACAGHPCQDNVALANGVFVLVKGHGVLSTRIKDVGVAGDFVKRRRFKEKNEKFHWEESREVRN